MVCLQSYVKWVKRKIDGRSASTASRLPPTNFSGRTLERSCYTCREQIARGPRIGTACESRHCAALSRALAPGGAEPLAATIHLREWRASFSEGAGGESWLREVSGRI